MLSEKIATYLAHTSAGLTLRQIAKLQQCHPSTILRQVRRVEVLRDDPLIDEALEQAGPAYAEAMIDRPPSEEYLQMKVQDTLQKTGDFEARVDREARRILRRLCEKNAFLVVAPDMEVAAVLRETVPGSHNRIAVVDRTIARAFAWKEWIKCERSGRVARYSITSVGRSALKRLLEEERLKKKGKTEAAESNTPFQRQHQDPVERTIQEAPSAAPRRVRYNLAESPLTVLGRKKTNSGRPYLTEEMIQAGERLREDFEIGQLGPKVGQNWDRFLAASDKSSWSGGGLPSDGAMRSRDRLSEALSAMGPGLADVAFRVCCFLEGLETAEKRMGWSARSGKVVLRIALDRLARHYGLIQSDQTAQSGKDAQSERRSA